MNGPYTATEISQMLAEGMVGAPEFLRERWRHLCRANELTRDAAWITLASEAQLEVQIDALRDRDPKSCPLYGVPFAAKDNIDVDGWVTTAACPEFAYKATRTAHVVEQLQSAGAILLGKTNLDQFATGLVGTRSPYGSVPNAFSAQHISGGSSSGSASVVARGLVAFALGTDTAGSGRVPAAFNNLIGCKPTPGIVSTHGVVPACKTLDCVSLLTLTAADAAVAFGVMAAPGALRRASPIWCRSHEPRYALPPRPRVGALSSAFFRDAAYRQLYDKSILHLTSLDCEQGYFDLAPFSEVAALLYEGPWTAERYAVAGALIEAGAPSLDPVVANIISTGSRYSAVDLFNALYRLRDLDARTQSIWDSFDVLMVPSAPCLPRVVEIAEEPALRNTELGTYTNFVNLLGLAAVAVPAGFTEDGLPFGVTFIAPGGNDWALIDFAGKWQRSLASPIGANLRPLRMEDTGTIIKPSDSIPVAVVGAHLSGMPLHHQLIDIGARLQGATFTAASYRLYALPNTAPPKPGLVRSDDGAQIAVEVYDCPASAVGRFLSNIAAPLGLGRIELQDGAWVTGFICEPWALRDAKDITSYGGWRNFMMGNARPASGQEA